MVTGIQRRELEPLIDEHDRRVRELQQDLLQLHASLKDQAPGDEGYESTVARILVATDDLLEYEAGIPAARAAKRAARRAEALRRQRLIIWWLIAGIAVAGVVVVVLAATGVLSFFRLMVGIGVVLTAAAMAASMRDHVVSLAGAWALTLRRAVVLAVVTVFVVVCAGLWTPGTFVVVPAVVAAALPLVAANSGEAQAVPRRGERRG